MRSASILVGDLPFAKRRALTLDRALEIQHNLSTTFLDNGGEKWGVATISKSGDNTHFACKVKEIHCLGSSQVLRWFDLRNHCSIL